MAILLIGSTGNGKSTLGNFMVNPEKDHIFGEWQTFKTARTNKPETQVVQTAAFKVKLGDVIQTLSVIDTPGIFEDEDRDIEHMINIIKALHKAGRISAIILVVKYSSKVDTPYKASIRYYAKLLPGLFETNLMIVMTDYACDERSKNLRSLQGINEEAIKENVLLELATSCGVKEMPKLFTIDCLPMSEQEFVINLQSRNDIILHAFSLETMSTRGLKLAKTDKIMAEDRVSKAALVGEVTAQDRTLEEIITALYKTLAQAEQHSMRLKSVSHELEGKCDEVAKLDTEELVNGGMWSVRTQWKWLKTQSRKFEVTSKWPIQGVSYWTNGKCRWTQREYTSACSIRGSVKSNRTRGLYARVILQVFKKDKFGDDVAGLRESITSKEELLGELEMQHDHSKKQLDQMNHDIQTLRENIERKKVEISILTSEYLTMEECLERFHV